MLLQLQPPGPHNPFQLLLSFPDLSPGLPNPPNYTTQITTLLQHQLDLPGSMNALDKAVGITTLLECVKFDMRTLRVRCDWVDGEVMEWSLVSAGDEGDAPFLKALEGLLRDVNKVRVEEERWKLAAEQQRRQEEDELQSRHSNSGGKRFSIRSPPSSMKLNKHKRQRSFLKTIVSCVGSIVNIASSSASSPSVPPNRPPPPPSSFHPISITSFSSTSSLPTSLSPSSMPPSPISPFHTADSTSLGHHSHIVHLARLRLRASLVDLFRRFVLTRLSSPSSSRSVPAIVTRQGNREDHLVIQRAFHAKGHVIHNYHVWVLRSMLKAVDAQLAAINANGDDMDMDHRPAGKKPKENELRLTRTLKEKKRSRGKLLKSRARSKGPAGKNLKPRLGISGVIVQEQTAFEEEMYLGQDEGPLPRGQEEEDTLTFCPTTMVVPSSFSDDSEDEGERHGIEIGDEQHDEDPESQGTVEIEDNEDADADGDTPSISSHASVVRSVESTFSSSSSLSSSSAHSSSTSASSTSTHLTYPEGADSDSIKASHYLEPSAQASSTWGSALHSQHSGLSQSPTPTQESNLSSSLSYTQANLFETQHRLRSLLVQAARTARSLKDDDERVMQMLEVRGRRRAWSCGELRSLPYSTLVDSPSGTTPSVFGLAAPFRSSPLALHSFTATDGEREGWEYEAPPNPHPIFHGYDRIHRQAREGGFASFVFGGASRSLEADGKIRARGRAREVGYAKYETGDGWEDESDDDGEFICYDEQEEGEQLRNLELCLDDSWNSEATLEEDEEDGYGPDVVELGHGSDPREWMNARHAREESIYDLPPRPRLFPTKNHPPPARLFPVSEEVEEDCNSDATDDGRAEEEEFEFDCTGRSHIYPDGRIRQDDHFFELDPDLDDVPEDQFDDDIAVSIEEGWGDWRVARSPEFDIEMGFGGRCQVGRSGNRSTCHPSQLQSMLTPQAHSQSGQHQSNAAAEGGSSQIRPRNHRRRQDYHQLTGALASDPELGSSGIRIALDVECPTRFGRDIAGLNARSNRLSNQPRVRTNSMYRQRLDGLGLAESDVIDIGPPPSVPCVSFSPPPVASRNSQNIPRPPSPTIRTPSRLTESSLLCQPVSFAATHNSAVPQKAVDLHVHLQVRELEMAGYRQFSADRSGRSSPTSPTSPPPSASSSSSCYSDCSSASLPMSPPSIGQYPTSPVTGMIPPVAKSPPSSGDSLMQVSGTWGCISEGDEGSGEGEEFTLAMDVPNKKKNRKGVDRRSQMFNRGPSSSSQMTTTITKASAPAPRRKGIDISFWEVPGPLVECR